MAVVPTKVSELVETFDRHIEAYHSQQYNETQLRREFIDPFFETLGWDVTNIHGYAQAYKDVIHEESIKIGSATKAPDYSFRIGGVRKFFLEAKKPSVDIKGDPHPAYQLRRYAWSAKLPLSILTDFEELAVYDCRVRPKHTDKADVARIMLFNYKDYLKNFSEIADIFSKEAILKGSFDKFAIATKGKRGTSTVDTEFLGELERWRAELARIIALKNTDLSAKEINFAVQRTIDRILFLRMCEDRGIEPYGQLQSISSGHRTYLRLCEVFESADKKYNSGLFHFHDEPNQPEAPDELTPNLVLPDHPIQFILHSLYYPQSPYEFSVLPAEILGNVYEQFLGNIIQLSPGHRAKIVAKPEVKKSGGVYYTPSYIVDYIVKNTVGKLCERKTPRQVSNIKILDPACGSGSFLIGAYQYLLDWHLKHYTENEPEKYAKGRNPKIFETNSRHSEQGEKSQHTHYGLTITEKKRILLNNIFGIDIDSQAVEVTKLSLLLKVLEGESSGTIDNQYRHFHERVLPDLANNIKCGNSLIGPDFYDNLDPESITEEFQQQINTFDWNIEFSEIFSGKNPGFDVIIGNPPYDVLEKDRKKASWPHITLAQYVKKSSIYESALGGKLNLFRFFIVRSSHILRENGYFGMIVPLSLLGDISCSRTRLYMIRNLDNIIINCFPQKDNPSRRVFLGAKLSTLVMIGVHCSKRIDSDANMLVRVYPWNSFDDPYRESQIVLEDVKLLDPKNLPIPLIDAKSWDLCVRIHTHKFITRLGLANDFQVHRGEINQTIYRSFITDDPTMCRLLKGVEVGRFRFNTTLSQSTREWLDEQHFLESNRPKLCSNRRRIATQRITGVDERLRVVAMVSDPPVYFADSTNSILKQDDSLYSLEYLLGILNSKLTQWRFKITSTNNNVGTNEIESLPFRIINFNDSEDIAKYNKMVMLVERMLDLNKRLGASNVPVDKTRIQRQIDTTDKQIDNLVYDLYSLTEDEIAIVENSGKNKPNR